MPANSSTTPNDGVIIPRPGEVAGEVRLQDGEIVDEQGRRLTVYPAQIVNLINECNRYRRARSETGPSVSCTADHPADWPCQICAPRSASAATMEEVKARISALANTLIRHRNGHGDSWTMRDAFSHLRELEKLLSSMPSATPRSTYEQRNDELNGLSGPGIRKA